MKGEVEEETEKEHYEEDHAEGIESVKYEKTMNGACKSFRVDGRGELIKEQVKTLGLAKVQMHLWVVWKKPIEMGISLSAEVMEKAQNLES